MGEAMIRLCSPWVRGREASPRIRIRGISDRRTAPIRCSAQLIASSGSAQLGWVRQETERTDPVHKRVGQLHEQFDFIGLLSQQEATIDGADLRSHRPESILNLGDLVFRRTAARFTLLRDAGNCARPFFLQLAKGHFQVIRLPRPTDEVLIGLSTSF